MSHVPPAQPLHPRRVPASRSIINRDRRLCSDHKARALHVHGAYSHQLVPSILSTAVSSELRPASLRRPHPSHLLEFWSCPQSPTPTGAARGGSFAIRRGSSSLVFRLESPAPAAEFRGRSRGHARARDGGLASGKCSLSL